MSHNSSFSSAQMALCNHPHGCWYSNFHHPRKDIGTTCCHSLVLLNSSSSQPQNYFLPLLFNRNKSYKWPFLTLLENTIFKIHVVALVSICCLWLNNTPFWLYHILSFPSLVDEHLIGLHFLTVCFVF